MKALVKEKAEIGLHLKDVEVPKVGDNDVLIKVKSTAICGTDLHIWNWDSWASKAIKPPLTLGHEFMGTIHKVGTNVDRFRITVSKSLKNISVQIIDDKANKTIVSAS